MKKGSLCLLWLCLLTLCGGCAQRDDPIQDRSAENRLVIGCEIYQPYTYLDQDGSYAGVDVELAREACRRLGYTPEFVQIEWDKKNDLLAAGQVDCLWSGFVMTGRETEYEWAGPYLTTRHVVAVQADEAVESLSDLEGRTVAVQATSMAEHALLQQWPGLPRARAVYSFATIDEAYACLRRGYADAVAGHEDTLRTLVDAVPGEYRLLDEALCQAEVGVAFARGCDRTLVEELSRTLAEMEQDGTIRSVLDQYGMRGVQTVGEKE